MPGRRRAPRCRPGPRAAGRRPRRRAAPRRQLLQRRPEEHDGLRADVGHWLARSHPGGELLGGGRLQPRQLGRGRIPPDRRSWLRARRGWAARSRPWRPVPPRPPTVASSSRSGCPSAGQHPASAHNSERHRPSRTTIASASRRPPSLAQRSAHLAGQRSAAPCRSLRAAAGRRRSPARPRSLPRVARGRRAAARRTSRDAAPAGRRAS